MPSSPFDVKPEEIKETKAAFARRLGVSRQAVQNYSSNADFPVDGAGKVRVEAALEWLTLNVRGHGTDADADADGSLVAARIALLKAQTARQEIALSKERGELIPYSEAQRALAAFMRLNRDVFLQFAVRHGPAIAVEVECDDSKLIASLSAHLRDALSEAADNPRPFLHDAPAAETDAVQVKQP